MFRAALLALFCFILAMPSIAPADDSLAALESVVAAGQQVQPGLQNYLATVETARIGEMMGRMTTGMPADVKPPPAPVIKKFWQRSGESVVYAPRTELTTYVAKMVEQLSANLAVELNEMLLPSAQAARRSELVKGATVKSSEVVLADTRIQRLEITFAGPTDLDGAFYASGMRLPQKQVSKLTFDIDSKTSTVSELLIAVDGGLHLTVELRYLAVAGGHIPERFKITSPDGKIDDLFEVKFVEAGGYLLPASMRRIILRPDLQDDLEVFFKDYQVNGPAPEDLPSRLKTQ